MNMTDHERPGVYSSYDASAIVSGSGAGKTVGLVGVGTCEEMGTVVPISRQEEAVAAFGAGTALTELVRLLLLNGAAAVRAVAVTGTEDYAAAMNKENTALYDAVNTAMQELLDDGTIQSIIDKYITAD